MISVKKAKSNAKNFPVDSVRRFFFYLYTKQRKSDIISTKADIIYLIQAFFLAALRQPEKAAYIVMVLPA